MEKLKPSIYVAVTNDLTFDQRMIRSCTSLAQAGFHVTLIGRKLPHSHPLTQQPFIQKRLTCFFHSGPLFYAEYTLRLFFYLLTRNAQGFVSVDLDTILAVSLASTIRSIPFVWDAHEYFTEVPELHNRKAIKRIWNTIGNLCVPHAKAWYTVSGALAEIFSQQYKKPFQVIRNVPLSRDLAKQDSQKHTLIYQGDLNPGRGLELYIELIAITNSTHLYIAGDGPLKHTLIQLAQKLQVSSRVTFTGYLQAEELAKLTASCYVGLNLLEAQSKSYYYSLSNKFFNYIHASIPQICSPYPEYNTLNNTYHVAVFASFDITSLLNAYQKLVADDVLHAQLVYNCQKAAELLNWEIEQQKLIALYDHTFAYH